MGAVPALVYWFVRNAGVNGAHLTLRRQRISRQRPMVVPPLQTRRRPIASEAKAELRKRLRSLRAGHVAALPQATRALIFMRPPAAVLDVIPAGATVGLYSATPNEAPTGGYARFFIERGHTIALPRFASRGAAMEFAKWSDPFGDSDLEIGPFGQAQPGAEAPEVTPDTLIVPLVGFTARGERLGQGGGHYDRWLEAHPSARAIGLAWDCQLVEHLPVEEHDARMAMIVTPTRMFGPF